MTTPPVDGEPPADMEDTTPDTRSVAPDGGDGSSGDSSGDSSDTDVMGIDDDDPIDATLVGGPVDDDPESASRPSGAPDDSSEPEGT